MKSITKIIIFTFTIFLCQIFSYSGVSSSNSSGNVGLKNKVLKLVHHKAGDLNVGVYVKDITNNTEVLSIHPNRLFTPASNVKVFTAYLALNTLGKDYRFKTTLSSNSKINQNGVLNADMHIKFTGDPSFTEKDLHQMFGSLGLKKIKGDLIVNTSILDDRRTSRGGFTWDDQPFCYSAPKGAVVVDKNCTEAWMKPQGSRNKFAHLHIDRPYVLDINNSVKIVTPQKYDCPFKSRYLGNNVYSVYGCMFNNLSNSVRLNFSLPDNNLMAKNYLQNTLKKFGVKISGEVRVLNDFPGRDGSYVLYMHQSKPLEQEILYDILKDSCNVSSANVFKYIAAKYTGRQGSDEDGENILKDFLLKNGFKRSGFRIFDGSGESKSNMVSPKTLVKAVSELYGSPKTQNPFINALPQYGRKGTLNYRSMESPYSKYIYAKTGTFHNTSTISGLYIPPKGNKYAFAIMINGNVLPWTEVKSLEDSILHLLIEK